MKFHLPCFFRSALTAAVSPLLLAALSSCAHQGPTAEIYRLDSQLSKGAMPEDSMSIKATELLFQISGYPEATPFTIGDYAGKPSIREHVAGVEAEFADTRRESEALGGVFARMAELLPEVRIPNVFAIISPFSQSILVADTTLFIGLNHYLGPDYSHYEYFPDYVRELKVRERIPVDVAEALIRTTYPFKPSGDYPQVVNRLAYEGAVAEAVMQVADVDEATALGYNNSRYGWLSDNEADIWKTIVGRELLFSTDYAIVRSLVDVAPHTSVISPEVPGRAGRFIGHRLVKAYLKNNPPASISTLLTPSFYESPSLLTAAKYNP